MKQNPIIKIKFNFSFKIKKVHTSERNGVMYARLEIFAVLPDSSAITQRVFAIAIVKMPFHANPRVSVGDGIKRLFLTLFSFYI